MPFFDRRGLDVPEASQGREERLDQTKLEKTGRRF
jgi:hypothetical protein